MRGGAGAHPRRSGTLLCSTTSNSDNGRRHDRRGPARTLEDLAHQRGHDLLAHHAQLPVPQRVLQHLHDRAVRLRRRRAAAAAAVAAAAAAALWRRYRGRRRRRHLVPGARRVNALPTSSSKAAVTDMHTISQDTAWPVGRQVCPKHALLSNHNCGHGFGRAGSRHASASALSRPVLTGLRCEQNRSRHNTRVRNMMGRRVARAAATRARLSMAFSDARDLVCRLQVT